MFAHNHEGIEDIEYNPGSAGVLIRYNPGMISEEAILAAVSRIYHLVIASIPRYMAAPAGVKESLFRANPGALQGCPGGYHDDQRLQLPDDIWR